MLFMLLTPDRDFWLVDSLIPSFPGSLILVGTIPHLLHVRMGEKKQKSSRKYELEFSPTSWPDSLPLQYEDKIFSVVCGNTHIKWCVHDSSATNFNPGCCWR
jgi:hypothetical protein